MVRVSVIIPSYNDAVLLDQCLTALDNQVRPADEVIVVDNNSTDDTVEVARRHGARVVAESIRGTLPATSAGLDAATGDILGRVDADSVPPVDWVQRVAEAFEENSALDALSGPGAFYGSNRAVHWIAENLYIGGYRWFLEVLLGHPPLFGSNFAIRREVWGRIRGTVHRTLRKVHDDLELSIHLEPDMGIRYDPTLRVGVSARPFDSLSGLWRRVEWAYFTFQLNWRERSLFDRRAERKRFEREQEAQARGALS